MKMKIKPRLSFEVEGEHRMHTLEVQAHLDNVYKLIDTETGETVLCALKTDPGEGPLTRAFKELFHSIMKKDMAYEVEVLSISPTMLMDIQIKNPTEASSSCSTTTMST